MIESVILEKIEKLNKFKAFVVDKVANAVLKKFESAFLKLLKLILDKSLSTGEVPMEWREANITPIFKKGSKPIHSNYRPVSLTSTISKILGSYRTNHASATYWKHLTKLRMP